jgi:glycerophosphoryl diester phosphodiesterase
MKYFKNKLLILLTIIGLFIFLNNTNLFSAKNSEPLLLAHRGIAQTFRMEGITGGTCTAERIHKPEHDFPEKTLSVCQKVFQVSSGQTRFKTSL